MSKPSWSGVRRGLLGHYRGLLPVWSSAMTMGVFLGVDARHRDTPPRPPSHQDHPLAARHRSQKTALASIYVVTSLTSPDATAADLARLVREHWSVEVHHHIRDVSFIEDTATNRTGHGPINIATLRRAITNALHDAGYLPHPRRPPDHTTPADALYLHGLIT